MSEQKSNSVESYDSEVKEQLPRDETLRLRKTFIGWVPNISGIRYFPGNKKDFVYFMKK